MCQKINFIRTSPYKSTKIEKIIYILSSYPLIGISISDTRPSVIVFPPAFSIKNAIGPTSYNTLSFALCLLDTIQLNTPCPLSIIWAASGARPPEYLSVYPLSNHLIQIFLYASLSSAALRFPGEKMLVFFLITKCSCERIHLSSISVNSWTLSIGAL